MSDDEYDHKTVAHIIKMVGQMFDNAPTHDLPQELGYKKACYRIMIKLATLLPKSK